MMHVKVVSVRKAFTKFTASEGLAVLNIVSTTSNSSLFSEMTLDMATPLPEGITIITGWRTVEVRQASCSVCCT
jgi:hypothetical protein